MGAPEIVDRLPEQRSLDDNAVALGGTPFGRQERDATRGLQVVARIGVGYDAVDVPALTEKKIPLMVAGTANSPSVAEHAIFLMMTLAKRAAHFHAMVQEGRWGTDRMKLLPVDLLGKTLLIVGFGRIGTRTARRALAMEMNVLVYDPYVYPWSPYTFSWYAPAPLRTWKSDWAIREDIEDELVWSPFVDANQVQVAVEDGIATLRGTVDTWSERTAAVNNAYEGGASSVVNDLEVEQGAPPKS